MIPDEKASLSRTLKYFAQSVCALLMPGYRRYDEFGLCSVCGRYTRFVYNGSFLLPDSGVALSCGWDERFIEEINVTNTLSCKYCAAKFRLRAAASSMLNYFWKGKVASVAELVKGRRSGEIDPSWRVLETALGGIFSGYRDLDNVVRSEYFDDVKRGSYKDGVRSEDLQSLTFGDNIFDAVIALDVFEHIADPWKAFAEVRRVLKPGGCAFITFPLDERIAETKAVAALENGKMRYFGKEAYHSDPLREEGSPVFTEFGTDIKDILISRGYNAALDIYTAKRSKVKQTVLLLTKRGARP